ncbi:MAG: hypothetical protein IIZ83_07850 [Oscillospiraceae bacterium]|nr:hypothetical protein [Oscillospiraceae bacterium]
MTDSVAPQEGESDNTERYSVRNMTELQKALIGMVYDGAPGGSIAFDASYSGDAAADMENACWQVRTQDSLCAYCVRDISYEMEKIVNYYESAVTIDYTSYAAELSSIIQLPYAVGLEDILSTAMEENRQRITILIGTSSYSVENMKSLALDLYRENPTLCVREPQLTVFMYSGAGRQRLYEINFHYGMAEDEVIRCKSQLKNLDVVSNLNAEGLDEVHGALAACRYLTENCVYSQSAEGSCYDALILRESNSEGLALAYVEMCHQLGIECLAVYGQMSGSDHCWNIVKIDGDYYHVDVSRCYDGDYADGFLLDDESMWNDYRWNISNYPACTGKLRYGDVAETEGFISAIYENAESDVSSEP